MVFRYGEPEKNPAPIFNPVATELPMAAPIPPPRAPPSAPPIEPESAPMTVLFKSPPDPAAAATAPEIAPVYAPKAAPRGPAGIPTIKGEKLHPTRPPTIPQRTGFFAPSEPPNAPRLQPSNPAPGKPIRPYGSVLRIGSLPTYK